MRVKSNNDRFAPGLCRCLFEPFNDLAVAGMNPIEGADGGDRMAEYRQPVYIAVYLHIVRSLAAGRVQM